jgi:uncharacterized coiled-coil DUF342 family protein
MLETEIKNLIAAIERLTEAVDKNQLSLQLEAPTAEPVAEAEQPVVEAPKVEQDTPSVDSLQQRCLEITRIDRANSAKIKDIIAEYGAALLKDIPADKLGEFSIKLEALV